MKSLNSGAKLASTVLVSALLLAPATTEAGQTPASPPGTHALADAVQAQNPAAVKRLLAERTALDVNAPQGDGATALHWAAQWNDAATVELLLKAGANVNAQTDQGITPLALVCVNANAALATRLLDTGANPNLASIVGETPLMAAARTGNVDLVKALIAHHADLAAKESSAGQTALMRAVAENHPAVVRALVDAGADVNAKSKNRFTPLMFAAQQGNPEVAKLLVEHHADVNATAPDGIGGDTDARLPFKANTEASVLLVAIDSAPEKEALFRARRGDDGAIDTTADARRVDYQAVALLLIDHGADVNQKGAGRTPLHAAVQRALPAVATALLARGSNPNARLEKALPMVSRLGVPVELGATPFWLAASYGDVEMMHLLVAAGADPALTSNDKTTPLMAAAGWNFLDGMDKYGRRWFRDSIAPVEQAALAAVKYCLELGLDVNAANNDGETAMWGAVYLGGTAMTQLLVDHGARINVKSKKKQTPWSLAQGRYNGTFVVQKDTSELLLKLGADPNLGELDPEVLLRQKRSAN